MARPGRRRICGKDLQGLCENEKESIGKGKTFHAGKLRVETRTK
jgi:hypothetical protein